MSLSLRDALLAAHLHKLPQPTPTGAAKAFQPAEVGDAGAGRRAGAARETREGPSAAARGATDGAPQTRAVSTTRATSLAQESDAPVGPPTRERPSAGADVGPVRPGSLLDLRV